MQMGMEVELLAPGMWHGGDAQIAPQPVAPERQQALGGTIEEQRVKPVRVGQHQGIKFRGQREDAMVVSHRQETLELLIQPLPAFAGLAARAMPVTAAAGRPVLMPAVRALEKIGAQPQGTTSG